MSVTLNTQLIEAAKDGDVNAVELALQAGADARADEDFALRWAAENGHKEVVALLLKYGSDVHADNDLALRWAAIDGHTDVVDLLLKAGADVHTDDDAALRYSAERGYLDVVDLLLKSGANIHAVNDYALRWASEHGQTSVVNTLIQHGADLTMLHKSQLNKNQITDILKQYAATAYRGYEAVMMLEDESCLDVLCHLHPNLKPEQSREELAMFEALGLDTVQMAEMWCAQRSHPHVTKEVSPCQTL